MATENTLRPESYSELYKKIDDLSISESQKADFIVGYLTESTGKSNRVFNYVEPFPATVAACQPAPFDPQFEHQNWVDGEDVVQAEDSASTGKRGFNWHFNAIQDDLEELSARINKQVQCLAELRTSLNKILTEIKNELNYINSHCCSSTNTGGVYPWEPYYPDWPYHYPPYTYPPINPGSGGNVPPKYYPPYGGSTPYGPMVNPADKYKGTVDILGTKYTVWDTPSGPMLGDKVKYGTTPLFENRSAEVVKKLVNIGSTDAEIVRMTGNGFSVGELNKKLGTKDIGNGDNLGTILSTLPQDSKYPNWNAFVSDVTSRLTGAMALDPGYQASIEVLKGDNTSASTSELDVAMIPGVSPSLATELKAKGVKTVGQLADIDPGKLSSGFGTAGGKLGPMGAAGLIGNAKMLNSFGKMG